MRINHNLPALNANRNMGINNDLQSKAQEKLSSGLRINRAADDAAGLAISEGMRNQIKGLTQASRNSQDAISLIQTAEGALTETHSILQRMRELGVQASNDTLTANDRSEIQKEVEQLKSEVDRIANTTSFNNKTLLDGSASAITSADKDTTKVFMRGGLTELGVSSAGTYRINLQESTAGKTQVQISNIMYDKTNNQIAASGTQLKDVAQFYDASGKFMLDDPQSITLIQGDGKSVSFTISGDDTLAKVADKFKDAISGTDGLNQGSIGGVGANASNIVNYNATGGTGADAVSGSFVISSARAGENGTVNMIADQNIIKAFGFTEYQKATATTYTVNIYDASKGTQIVSDAQVEGTDILGLVHKNVDVQVDSNAAVSSVYTAGAGTGFTISAAASFDTTVHLVDNSQVFQIGANELQNMNASIGNMTSASLGINGIKLTDVVSAGKAITKLDAAISRVSSQRSSLGAIQNRLEHTINNLGVASENITASESRIRDVNMAEEMMNYTKLNVLSQASMAMLAQANQQPQQVLQLLGR